MTVAEEYRFLLGEIDRWFSRCQQHSPQAITCSKGCSQCCRGLFDITILDAALLNTGFGTLSDDARFRIRKDAEERLRAIQSLWPEFQQPFTLNHRQEEEIETLLATDNESPCLLLDAEGSCLLYEYRPMTCRLHGLPLIDVSGEVLESEWCSENFSGTDPFTIKEIRGEFTRMLYREAELGRCYTAELLGKDLSELDTLIPTAILINFRSFDWRKWYAQHPVRT